MPAIAEKATSQAAPSILSLPVMSSTSSNHELTPLALKLLARIAVKGPITVFDYMDACLYDPQYGYYRHKSPLGRTGDFITAPEISQIFGELIGLWAAQIWRQMGEPPSIRLIEAGPGRGTLMADALRALRAMPRLLETMTIHLVETSNVLRRIQEQALVGKSNSVQWHATLDEVPAGPSILIANEYLDCLPVRQFIFDSKGERWQERIVTISDGSLKMGAASVISGDMAEGGASNPVNERAVKDPLPAALRSAVISADLEDGAVLEFRPGVEAAVQTLRLRARKSPLAALFIDYGHTRSSLGDTLQAVKHHRFCGVFDAPGEMDLTAHVDFAHLKHEAVRHGFTAFGPMPMGEWLLKLGLEKRHGQLMRAASAEQAIDLESQIRRLVDPSQMGMLFKVFAMTHGVSGSPPPFPPRA